jgi:hypothetical protein
MLPNGKTMTREDIIRMARKAGMPYFYGTWEIANLDSLERFAALVAAHERKECAKVAENGLIGHTIAKAIRARGEK